MKLFALMFAGLVIGYTSSVVWAQEKPMTPEEQAWGAYMTPGPMHMMLKNGEGKWKVTTTMWMKPGDPPTVSEGEAESKMVLGGRYLQTQMHGTMMGQPYEGMGYDAYDNALGQFISTWYDNMGTGVMSMHGTIDANKKVISYKGSMVDPMTKTESDAWSTWTMIDPDHQMMEMFAMVKGEKVKTFEMKMEREK